MAGPGLPLARGTAGCCCSGGGGSGASGLPAVPAGGCAVRVGLAASALGWSRAFSFVSEARSPAAARRRGVLALLPPLLPPMPKRSDTSTRGEEVGASSCLLALPLPPLPALLGLGSCTVSGVRAVGTAAPDCTASLLARALPNILFLGCATASCSPGSSSMAGCLLALPLAEPLPPLPHGLGGLTAIRVVAGAAGAALWR